MLKSIRQLPTLLLLRICSFLFSGYRVVYTFLLIMLIHSAPLYAQEASISDLIVVNSRTHLLAYYTLQNGFTVDILDGLQHGIPITFTFETELERVRSGWFDKTVRSQSFEHTMTYDTLKKIYVIQREEDAGKRFTTTDLREAESLMTSVTGLAVVALDRMRPNQQYTLRVKATLEKTTLPLNFHYLVPFSEFWDLKTEWAELHFIY